MTATETTTTTLRATARQNVIDSVGEAAVKAHERNLGPQIADAIRAGIEAGGDPGHWDAPEFADARRLTEEAGCQWDFNGWDAALESLNPLQEGGPMLGGVRFGNDVREGK